MEIASIILSGVAILVSIASLILSVSLHKSSIKHSFVDRLFGDEIKNIITKELPNKFYAFLDIDCDYLGSEDKYLDYLKEMKLFIESIKYISFFDKETFDTINNLFFEIDDCASQMYEYKDYNRELAQKLFELNENLYMTIKKYYIKNN